jgi:hypothetical protein
MPQVMRTVRKKPPLQKTDVGSAVQDPVWVIRVELTVRRSLPVFLDKRTISELVAGLKGANALNRCAIARGGGRGAAPIRLNPRRDGQ